MLKKVSIVLATYKPNSEFFIKQLISINSQTYKNLELLVCDDSGNDLEFSKIKSTVNKYINNITYTLCKNKKNLGSNKTFEKLSEMSSGDYIAFCDQDDIWEKNKIEKLVNKIEQEKAVLCYSDLSVINEVDELISDSFLKYSTRLKHVYGNNKFGFFLRRNSVTGCAMLVKSEVVKKCLPFPRYDQYVHDHWITLCASTIGSIAYVNEPLVKYRIHSNNQIGSKVLSGIKTRKDYLYKKVYLEMNKVDEVKKRKLGSKNTYYEKKIKEFESFIQIRINFFETKSIKNTMKLLLKLYYDPLLVSFEFFINLLPEPFSEKLIGKVRN